MASQLRHFGKRSVSSNGDGVVRGPSNRPTLTQLVMAAADSAREKPALVAADHIVTFGDLRARAQGAATAMSRGPRVDDAALTVAVMTAVPGLALAGPQGLADTLATIRIQATMVLAEADLV